jgi:hypothetical protein
MRKDRFASGSIDATRLAIASVVGGDAVLNLIGPPASGKSMTCRALEYELKLPLLAFYGAELNRPESLACPGRDPGDEYVSMYPSKRLAPAFDSPRLVFFDEVNQAPQDVMGMLMPLALDRRLVDREFAPGSRVVMAMNPGGTGVATRRMGWALVSRLAQIWYAPSTAEKVQLKRAGYPSIPLGFDEARRDVYHGYLDALLIPFWEENPQSCATEAPADWAGEPIPESRGWEQAMKLLATCRAMDAVSVTGSASTRAVRRDAEHIVLAAKVGPVWASNFLAWERAVSMVKPIDVLEGRDEVPDLRGAKAAGWWYLLGAEAIQSPENLQLFTDCIPKLEARFSADTVVVGAMRITRALVGKDAKLGEAWEGANTLALVGSMRKAFGPAVNEALRELADANAHRRN